MNNNRILIKVGGAALVDDSVLETVTQAIQSYRRAGYKVAVVHGGGPAINANLTKAGIKWNFVDGQRVTTPQMMNIIESTLCGEVNRKLVRYLSAAGLPTMGFAGTDNHTLMCTRSNDVLGQVGQIQAVNCAWVEVLMGLPSAPVPVMAPIGIGYNGEAYNINADWAATRLAGALNVGELIFLTDQDGILDKQKNLISAVTPEELQALVDDGTVQGGMLTKVKSILHARKNGIASVRVVNGKKAMEAVMNEGVGTISKAPVKEEPKSRMAEFYATA